MGTRSSIAIDIGRRRLRALEATWERNRLKVRRSLVEPLPTDVNTKDPKRLGEWIGRMLEQGRFNKGKTTVAVSREHVVLKRLTLPTGEPAELPEMTRLALSRELPFEGDTAVIDYVTVAAGSASTTVLGVAAPEPVVSGIRQAARSAGLGVEHVSLRSMGAAALLSDPGRTGRTGEAVLAVDVTGERVEFSVVVDGVIRFSRAGELPETDDVQLIAEAVVTECRRTWMSYRIVDESEDVRRAIVLGDRRLAELVAGQIHYILQVETSVFEQHAAVDCTEDLGPLWPLAGLLLAPQLSVESIDFAHPHKAPDTASRRRQVVLGGIGLIVVLGLVGATVARFELQGREAELDSLTDQKRMRQPDYYRYGRDRYKLIHVDQWASAQPDWLGHLANIVDLAPPSSQLVLEDWTGTLTFKGVKFDKRSRQFSAPRELGIAVGGEATDRATADGFRGRLVERDVYDISTSGPDAGSGRRLPYGFQYNLRTGETSPSVKETDS